MFRSPPAHALVRLPWGSALRVNPREALGAALWYTGVYDLAVSEALWRLLDVGDTAVDAGANIGYMTSLMAFLTGPKGRVLAVEPHPGLFPLLVENIRLAAAGRPCAPVEAVEAALGERDGEAVLAWGDDFVSNAGTARVVAEDVSSVHESRVPLRRLDDLVDWPAVTLLKLDVEGYEAQVLRGAERLLSERRIAHILFEDHVGPQSAVQRLLADHGYSTFALGWRLLGPMIAPGSQGSLAHPWEPPSYIATLQPDVVRRRMAPRGWRIL
jgi:FkbM family methyltransferase